MDNSIIIEDVKQMLRGGVITLLIYLLCLVRVF